MKQNSFYDNFRICFSATIFKHTLKETNSEEIIIKKINVLFLI